MVALGGGADLGLPPPPQVVLGVPILADPSSVVSADYSFDIHYDATVAGLGTQEGDIAGSGAGTSGVAGAWTADVFLDMTGGSPTVTGLRFVSGEVTTTSDFSAVFAGGLTGSLTSALSLQPASQAVVPVTNGEFSSAAQLRLTGVSLSVTGGGGLLGAIVSLLDSRLGNMLEGISLSVPITGSVELQSGGGSSYEIRVSADGMASGVMPPLEETVDNSPLVSITYTASIAVGSAELSYVGTGQFSTSAPGESEAQATVQQSFPLVEGGLATGWRARGVELVRTGAPWSLGVHAICVMQP